MIATSYGTSNTTSCITSVVQFAQSDLEDKMSSSSTSLTNTSDGQGGQQPGETVDQLPLFKMAEEFKPKMTPTTTTTTCSKMSEDSQDSSQGQESGNSRYSPHDYLSYDYVDVESLI